MTAVQPPKTITIQDPREFDGDPYQVAERAIQQLRGLLLILTDHMEPVTLMVRNADLERQLAFGQALGSAGVEWPESPQGRQIAKVEAALADADKTLRSLERASAYNPKARESR